LPQAIEGVEVGTIAYKRATSGNPLFNLAVADKVTTDSFDMHPKDVMPFFPVEDALLGDVQVFGNLPKGDDEGFGVDAMAYALHGFIVGIDALPNFCVNAYL
jgi:hypothetical protein